LRPITTVLPVVSLTKRCMSSFIFGQGIVPLLPIPPVDSHAITADKLSVK
jgi:hypothetical protein